MDLALITARQVVILFVLILTGFACVKTGVLKQEAKKHFSDLLIYLIIPAMIINSYLTSSDKSSLSKLIQAFGVSALLLIVGFIVTYITGLPLKNENAPIAKFGCMFSNAAYMGFPLIEALYGSEGLIYASAFLTVYNIFLWTAGVAVLSKKANLKEILHSILTTPVLISVVIGLVIFILGIKLPEVIQKPIESIGSMNTSLSMIITGMLIAGTKIKTLFKNKLLYFIISVRMFLIPLICFFIYKLFDLPSEVSAIAVMLESCPAAAITSVMAVRYGYEENIAAGSVVITTFISIFILPLMAFLLSS